jgi:hypothetical protein
LCWGRHRGKCERWWVNQTNVSQFPAMCNLLLFPQIFVLARGLIVPFHMRIHPLERFWRYWWWMVGVLTVLNIGLYPSIFWYVFEWMIDTEITGYVLALLTLIFAGMLIS